MRISSYQAPIRSISVILFLSLTLSSRSFVPFRFIHRRVRFCRTADSNENLSNLDKHASPNTRNRFRGLFRRRNTKKSSKGLKSSKEQRIKCQTVQELSHQVDVLGAKLHNLDVQCTGGQNHAIDHPILELIQNRVKSRTKPSMHNDGMKLGLAIEGGGMRGCVSAGMVSCIHHLGIQDAFDSVYGSSAGCLVGAYFVSRQTNGTAIYHDVLPESGPKFLDKSRLVEALGFDFSLFRWDWWNLWRKRVMTDGRKIPILNSGGAQVFNLNFLMKDVVCGFWPLDWESFWSNNQLQPLSVVVSGLHSMSSHTLTSSKGHFSSLSELTRCMHASMLVPGLTGPLVTLPFEPDKLEQGAVKLDSATSKLLDSVDFSYEKGHQPCADALIFEPIPYRSAVNDGCTHVLVLRTRPDGSQVLGKKAGLYERRIARKYFNEFHIVANISDFLIQLRHLKIYAEDILSLARGGSTGEPIRVQTSKPGSFSYVHLLAIAPSEGIAEINQLEMKRKGLLQGCRDGFSACYEALASSEQRIKDGGINSTLLAHNAFPDSILENAVNFAESHWQPGWSISSSSLESP